MSLKIQETRDLLQKFDFKRLFIEELGWSNPPSSKAVSGQAKGFSYHRTPIAQLSGVMVFEIASENQPIPDAPIRAAIWKQVSELHHENLLIFLDQARTQSLWYWVKRDGAKVHPRDHLYIKGQPGDLFLSKLATMVVDISELDAEGNIAITEVAGRLKKALDIERVTKKFYTEFQEQHLVFLDLIEGIDNERERRWYASVLLNRLMFIWFLQKKFFLDGGNENYLDDKLEESRKRGRDRYYFEFLHALFFEGFAKPEEKRTPSVNKLLGKIKYLNGGLFLEHPVEQRWKKIFIPDKAFENLFALFKRYSWSLNDAPGGKDDEISPDVLGYIFEKYINQKAFGAYYTRPEITEYLCEHTIHRLLLDGVNTKGIPGLVAARQFENVGELLIHLDAPLCKKLLHDILPKLRLLDPACGSGAFLVAAMKTLINLYAAVIGKIKFLNDRALSDWLRKIEKEHPNVNYFVKKTIITDNLFGVDIMKEAVEIAKLRLFLALVAAAERADDLEPLPNIDFNILEGNSLIGLMKVDDREFENRTADLFRKSYRQVLVEKNRLVEIYRHAATYADDLTSLRNNIEKQKKEATGTLDAILLDEFTHLGIKLEQAGWDDKKSKEGKPVKRALKLSDIEALKPFHWGFEFDEIINQQGGFDAIITNPPWEIFKPNSKEFFEEFSDLVSKKKMTIKDFEKEQSKLLKDSDIRKAWLVYLSGYPHVSAFFRSAPQYKNQISVVNGKKAGTDINLYKLFTEQCFNLLRKGGYCGMVIPSGIYTDLGTKQLRKMLFTQTKIMGLFCFENRKEIFEEVDSRFKFLVLTYEKNGVTKEFPAAFMRHEVSDLERFPQEGGIPISVDLVHRLSPDSLSVMEFKTPLDVQIVEKMLKFPLLGKELPDKWNLHLTAEFHMTNESFLFKTESAKNRLPLYEGKMIWQFEHRFAQPRYWIDENAGRKALFGREKDKGQTLDYQSYRLGFRDIAASTNERTLVSTVIPPAFHGNKIPTVRVFEEGKRLVDGATQIFICAAWNSFVLDWMIRQRVSTTLNFFYLYQLPLPRLTEKDAAFRPIVERAARLICTTTEFDDLAKEVGLQSHKEGATNPVERAKLRAELDGLIAHLYGLTEEEFAHILSTFPLVPDPVKVAARNAYRDVLNGLIQ